ncbi:MAG: hypothetical protein APR62_03005 [Smithella sp. SDB]|nr:MAG: hypothetical protein APR62_03005 [Smithella sp. SDB]
MHGALPDLTGKSTLCYKCDVKNKNLFSTEINLLKDLSIQNPNALAQASGIRQSLMVWWIALRYHFTPSSFLPAIPGGVAAWTLTGFFNQWFFFLAVLGVTLNHIALNLTDDYFDYHASVDRHNYVNANPYSGGSGTLTGGKIKHAHMKMVFVMAYLATIVIGLYLCAIQTWWILAFGLLGMGSSYFYTAPPIRYGYRGLGEISQLINFSFTIGMGAYVVQTVSFSWEAFWVLLPLGFMMFAMIIINEIPDRINDAAAGKKTLVVRFGTKNAVWFYSVSMIMAFTVIMLAPFFGMASPWIYLSFFTLPWTVQAFCILRKQISDISQLAPANLLTIRVHNLTPFSPLFY